MLIALSLTEFEVLRGTPVAEWLIEEVVPPAVGFEKFIGLLWLAEEEEGG